MQDYLVNNPIMAHGKIETPEQIADLSTSFLQRHLRHFIGWFGHSVALHACHELRTRGVPYRSPFTKKWVGRRPV